MKVIFSGETWILPALILLIQTWIYHRLQNKNSSIRLQISQKSMILQYKWHFNSISNKILITLFINCFFSLCTLKTGHFYNVKYGLSVITSKHQSKILSNENIRSGVSRKIVCFGILIHVLSWRQQKHVFITEIVWLTFDVITDDPCLTL